MIFAKMAALQLAIPTPAPVLWGELTLSSSGYGLLSVPNDLARGVFAALDLPGIELPPVSGETGQFKAHITVLRPSEIEKIGGPDKLTERGKRFRYQLGPLCEVAPAGWPEMSRVWFISVSSPELNRLRRTYGLPGLPVHEETGNALPFHITVAVRRKHVLGTNDVSKAAG